MFRGEHEAAESREVKSGCHMAGGLRIVSCTHARDDGFGVGLLARTRTEFPAAWLGHERALMAVRCGAC